jgi:transcriptional regulator with XRE-family HTH domain
MAEDLPGHALGEYLRSLRTFCGLTLREVQERTHDAVKNGYLSQIETGHIARPAPEVLWHLSEVYSVSYNDLLVRAGHRAPDPTAAEPDTLAGMPLSTLQALDEDDKLRVREYIELLANARRRPPA